MKMMMKAMLMVVVVGVCAGAELRAAPRGDNAKVAEFDDDFLRWFVEKGGVARGVTVGQSAWGRGVFVRPDATASGADDDGTCWLTFEVTGRRPVWIM